MMAGQWMVDQMLNNGGPSGRRDCQKHADGERGSQSQSTNQSINQSINRSINQSISQSINQSIPLKIWQVQAGMRTNAELQSQAWESHFILFNDLNCVNKL